MLEKLFEISEEDQRRIMNLRKRLEAENKQVGYKEITEACAEVMAQQVKELFEMEAPEDIIATVTDTVGIFSARVLHILFTKED